MKSKLLLGLWPIYAPAHLISPGQAIMAETCLNLPLYILKQLLTRPTNTQSHCGVLSQAKGNDIWQAYIYTKPRKVEKLPPIQSDSGPQINFDGKCNAFIKAMDPKPPGVGLGQEADTAPRLEPWTEVTNKEIQNAIYFLHFCMQPRAMTTMNK